MRWLAVETMRTLVFRGTPKGRAQTTAREWIARVGLRVRGFNCLFGGLIDNASGTGDIFVSAEGNIQDPNVIALLIINNPSNPTSNIFFGDSALFACLYKDQI